MPWIYLSPHLDDGVLSCGGIICEQARAGDMVEIWTIFSGDPPPGPFSPLAEELHARWGTSREAAAVRRAEDKAACAALGALPHHLNLPDCIYRRSTRTGEPIVQLNDDLFGPIHADEQELVSSIAQRLDQMLPEDARVVSPLTIGGHMDHRIVRAAAEQLARPLWYYADYPYAVQAGAAAQEWIAPAWREHRWSISMQSLSAWQHAVEAYRSQISTFWPSVEAMRANIAAYRHQGGGCALWEQIKIE